ncbi:hypothetical protein NP493_848g03116 [Ridgeia piscesae]|uniref:Uncharacterized protein n=1 Tax=Ridgeia piscesae TaxID=27915 RepID=A0AAD9KNQ6_RIDPI|nr:hypothetical protein NP493_848g03116 [Ridgeia piscesae]
MVPLRREARMLLRPLVDTRTCDNACLNGGICEYEANDNVHYCLSVHSLLRHVREGQPRAVDDKSSSKSWQLYDNQEGHGKCYARPHYHVNT